MKKIFNRVLAAAIAVPMALTQSVVMNVSAEDTGAKVLTLDTFTAIPYDQTESRWNEAALNMFLNMEGTQKEITAADFINLIPQTNTYGVMLAELLADAPNPVLTVENGVVTVMGTADLSAYAEKKIYSKIREAAGMDLTLNAFSKQIDYYVTFDASVLADGKSVDVIYSVSVGGDAVNEDNAADYFKGLADELAAEVSAQVGVDAAIEEAMTIEIIDKIERAETLFNRAEALERTGSYGTADEMMAAIAKFVDKRTEIYNFPKTVDEAVARHGAGFNKAVDLISGIASTSGYVLDITADSVAELAKSGSDFNVAVSGGTYEVSFTIPDAEAAEVEAWVNENAVVNDEGVKMVYASSSKLVEASLTTDGVAFFDVTRIIEYKEEEVTTTSTTETTTDTTETSTETTVSTETSTDTTETSTETTVSTETSTDTTETSTETTVSTETSTDTTETSTDTTVSTETSTDTTETSTDTTDSTETSTDTTDSTETSTETTETSTDTTVSTESSTDTTDTTTSGTGTTTTTTEIPVDFILEDIEVESGVGYYFSHDENEFDLSKLINKLTLIGNINGEAKSFQIAASDFSTYLTPAFATPAEYFNNVAGTAYVASSLAISFNPANIQTSYMTNMTIDPIEYPTVYIGVKGDANLDGAVGLDDATKVLAYYANVGASLDASFNDDPNLEGLAYFLADVDTESTNGRDVAGENSIHLTDATAILTYYAYVGSGLDADWDAILGR